MIQPESEHGLGLDKFLVLVFADDSAEETPSTHGKKLTALNSLVTPRVTWVLSLTHSVDLGKL